MPQRLNGWFTKWMVHGIFSKLIFIQLIKIFYVLIYFRSIVMLKYTFDWTPVFNIYIYIRVRHPSVFSSDFPTKMLHINITSHFPQTCFISRQSNRFSIKHSKTFLEGHRIWSSSLCRYLRPSLPYSPLILSNFFSTWSLNTFRLYSYIQKRSYIYHLYTTRVTVMVSYILGPSFIRTLQGNHKSLALFGPSNVPGCSSVI